MIAGISTQEASLWTMVLMLFGCVVMMGPTFIGFLLHSIFKDRFPKEIVYGLSLISFFLCALMLELFKGGSKEAWIVFALVVFRSCFTEPQSLTMCAANNAN